ncbi:uncharacterized protein LOC126558138 [Anopheles maculipalpis]|uniref:uncharacterized protein LOC126558138 n=1 Tax=Anopheles maculipalpis TaxID=1496333 RepID=UPI002158E7E1|nr:uncharacterized protein LOC126558138 [Anopheles maculipalpis]
MSKEKSWKGFDQLLVSPAVRCRRSLNQSNGRRGQRRSRSSKHGSILHAGDQGDDWQIDDHSDDETLASVINASDTTLPSTITSSVPQSLNPAEITIERRHQSDSEVEHISEDECRRPQYDTTSNSSDSDDCLAISCTKSRMTRLQFLDKNPLKRRRITDDMDVSFGVGTSKAKNRQRQDIIDASSPKCFKPISSLNRTIQTNAAGAELLNNTVANRSTRCWKSFDTSFTEQETSWIEELPSSPETDNTNEQGPLNIEELPASAEDSSSRNRHSLENSSTVPAKSFYIKSPEANKSKKIHLRSSPLGTLEAALHERTSRQHLWHQAITFGKVQPNLVLKLDTIERIFGRVMLRFFTTTNETDECVREQVENVIFMDQGDKQLKSLHAGMEIALELDERIAPHRVSHNKLVHLGVTKLCPMPFAAK